MSAFAQFGGTVNLPVTRGVLFALLFVSLSLPAVAQESGAGAGLIPSLTERGAGLTIRHVSAQTGLPTFASGGERGILLDVSAVASAETRALAFVDAYGKAFGLESAAQVRAIRAHADELGLEHVRLQQLHEGVPVTGGELIVHLKGPRVLTVNGRTIADLPASVSPMLAPELADGGARQLIAKTFAAEFPNATFSKPRLEILNRSLLSWPGADRSRLAWFVEARGVALRQYIWIDANTGAVLLSFSQLAHAKNRTVYSAGNTNTLPGTLVRSEGGPAVVGDTDSNLAYDLSGVTYDYFMTNHGRDSYDGAGAELISTTHYCEPANCPNYANAFWNGTQMVYGNGYASADDVVGHELTHAVTERTAGLFYYYQSGALNESFSDIFGEVVDLGSAVGGGNDAGAVRWLMGEDLGIGAIRNMMNPGAFGDPARMTDPNFFCVTNGWTNPNGDSGGVHINSGVPNHAFALMVDGGTYNGRTITAIGIPKAAKIQYRALTTYLTAGSGFMDAYNAVNQSCTDLIGTLGITAANCTEVQEALEAVEMNLIWGCSGAVPAPAQCPAGTPVNVYSEGYEGVVATWTGASTGTGLWGRLLGYAKTGQASAYGDNPATTSVHTWTMNSGVMVPAGGRAYFDHQFEFENFNNATFYDGGQLLYSTNGGSTWTDASALIDGGETYAGALWSGSPLPGQQAFGGTSFGWTGTRLNLASLAGSSIRFQFKLVTDSSVGSLGWMVDNFSIYSCDVPLAWTDDPLVAGTTHLKAVHLTELRSRVNTVRATFGLGAFAWTNAITAGSTLAKAVDVIELRTALAAAYTAAAMTQPVYVDPSLPAGTTVKVVHISQLRAAVEALE